MSKGRFGVHGGQYIPETLMNAMLELEEAYKKYKDDPEFNRELTEMLNEYAGRPSRLYYAERMTKDLGGAKIYLRSAQILCHSLRIVKSARSSRILVEHLCEFSVKLRIILIFLVSLLQLQHRIHQSLWNVLAAVNAKSAF